MDISLSYLDNKEEGTNPKNSEDVSSISEESCHIPFTCTPSPALEGKKRTLDSKPLLVSKLLTEATDSQQSLSTNSPDYFDEETAV